jgi:predicted Holliday junction resolvase-like endonuclease
MQLSLPASFLAIVIFLVIIYLTYKLSCYKTDLKWQKNLVKLRGDIANSQRANIKGKVTETFAPFLEGFPFKASECKFLGDPIDFVAFEGLDERDVKGVHFVDVKSGGARLSKHQKQIKDLIDSLNSEDVTFREFRFDNEHDKLGEEY